MKKTIVLVSMFLFGLVASAYPTSPKTMTLSLFGEVVLPADTPTADGTVWCPKTASLVLSSAGLEFKNTNDVYAQLAYLSTNDLSGKYACVVSDESSHGGMGTGTTCESASISQRTNGSILINHAQCYRHSFFGSKRCSSAERETTILIEGTKLTYELNCHGRYCSSGLEKVTCVYDVVSSL